MRLIPLAVLVLAVGCTNNEAPKAAPAVAAATDGLSGRVAETFDAATYTYLRLEGPGGEVWAAIPTAKVAVGRQVTLVSPVPMKNFTSKTLNRTFPLIQFAAGITEGQGPVAAAAPPAPAAEPSEKVAADRVAAAHAHANAMALPSLKVEKATAADAKTVAELYAAKAAVTNQPVSVRGQVVKVTTGVLGKNWLHLRDGSGSDATKDNDLAVTTAETVVLGDIVTVSGAVHADRDFGAGYLFPVIIEDAKILRSP